MTTKNNNSDDETYADVLNCAAKLLAWQAAKRRKHSAAEAEVWLRSAADCIILSDMYHRRAG